MENFENFYKKSFLYIFFVEDMFNSENQLLENNVI